MAERKVLTKGFASKVEEGVRPGEKKSAEFSPSRSYGVSSAETWGSVG